MAQFQEFGISKGWWFYFELRCGISNPEFKAEFIEELSRLITEDEGSFVVYDEDDKIKKRIQVRGVRG